MVVMFWLHLFPAACNLHTLKIRQARATLMPRINSRFPVAASGAWKTVLLTRGTQNYVLAVVLLVSFSATKPAMDISPTEKPYVE